MSRLASWFAGGLVAQAPTTTTAQTTGATALGLNGNQAIALIVLFGAALVLIWLVPLMLDTWRAYRLRSQVLALIEKGVLRVAGRDGLTLAELRAVLATLGRPATGQSGLNRALMALTITSAVGIALLFLLLTNSTAATDLGKTALTTLLGILATIVGFYFGTRAGEPAEVPLPPGPRPPSEAATAEPEEPAAPTAEPEEPAAATAEPEGPAAPTAEPEGPAAPTAEPASEVSQPPSDSAGGTAEAASPTAPAAADEIPFDRRGDFEAEPEEEAEPERPPFDVDKELEGKGGLA